VEHLINEPLGSQKFDTFGGKGPHRVQKLGRSTGVPTAPDAVVDQDDQSSSHDCAADSFVSCSPVRKIGGGA